MDMAQDENSSLYIVSRIVGELFEELEMSVDSVDQMMALFLALSPLKIEILRNEIPACKGSI